MNDNNSRSKCLCDLEEGRTGVLNNTRQTTSVKVMATQVLHRPSLGRPCRAHHGGLEEDGSFDLEETDVHVKVANDPIIVASVPTNPDSAPLGVEGAPFQEAVLPSDLLSMMRWLHGDEVEASSLYASRVVEKLVVATTKAFAKVQGKRRGELRLSRGESSCYAATVANATSRFSPQSQPPCPSPPRRTPTPSSSTILLHNLHLSPPHLSHGQTVLSCSSWPSTSPRPLPSTSSTSCQRPARTGSG